MEDTQTVDTAVATEDKPFDFAAWKAERNAKEAAARSANPPAAETPGKPAEAKPPTSKEEPADEPLDESPRLSRSQRRELNQLRQKLGEAEGRAKMLQELVDRGLTPKQATEKVDGETKPESITQAGKPVRAGFKTDEEFFEALTDWKYDQRFSKDAAEANAKREADTFISRVDATRDKYNEDVKDYPDWEEAQEAMAAIPLPEDKEAQVALLELFGTSDNRAAISYHYAKHPEEFKKLTAMSIPDMKAAFYRTEGRVEKIIEKKAEEKVEKPAVKTTSERDAKKAKPTETVGARAGTPAAADEISPVLSDGVTLNPAWKAAQAAKHGYRP